ncbi:MAG: SMC-Scp complex subunit ScpB [Candidatus Nitrospinota bacterium M3_3B_026]
MDKETVKAILENILFVADEPLPLDRIASVLEGAASREEAAAALDELREDYASRGLQLAEVAGGWRLQTRPEHAEWVTKFFKMERGQRLSRASLEVLAIIAYRQPITRAEIDEVRGVDSGGVLRGLVEKDLVKTMGRRKAPGRPMMYGTTKRFLEYFGLASLSDLPTMEEFSKELAESLEAADVQETLDFEAEVAAGARETVREEEGGGSADDDAEESLDPFRY